MRDPTHVDLLAPRLLFDLGDARVLAAGFQQHLAHMFGVVLQRGGHRVQADDPLGLFAHPPIVQECKLIIGPNFKDAPNKSILALSAHATSGACPDVAHTNQSLP